MVSTRSRAPESGPIRQGPSGRSLMMQPGFKASVLNVARGGLYDLGLQSGQIGSGDQFFFGRAFRIVRFTAPGELQIREADTTAASGATATQGVVLEKTQAFDHAIEERGVLLAENIHDKADAKAG